MVISLPWHLLPAQLPQLPPGKLLPENVAQSNKDVAVQATARCLHLFRLEHLLDGGQNKAEPKGKFSAHALASQLFCFRAFGVPCQTNR